VARHFADNRIGDSFHKEHGGGKVPKVMDAEI
jgi:hypothetical protein